jgi:hypothetical protein
VAVFPVFGQILLDGEEIAGSTRRTSIDSASHAFQITSSSHACRYENVRCVDRSRRYRNSHRQRVGASRTFARAQRRS